MATQVDEQYLRQLGVNKDPLTPEELASLDRDGYVSLGCLLDSQQLAEIHALTDDLTQAVAPNDYQVCILFRYLKTRKTGRMEISFLKLVGAN